MSNKKPLCGITQWIYFAPHRSITASVGCVYELGKILDFCAGGRQNLGNTVGRWPTGLTFFGPAFTAVEGGWIQTTAFCQSGTRHTVFCGKTFNGTPHIVMGHFLSPIYFYDAKLIFFLSGRMLILFQISGKNNKFHFLGIYAKIV